MHYVWARMTPNKRILISVKYNRDHIVERSLSAYLKKRGHETYLHVGTTDALKRAAPTPLLPTAPAILIDPRFLQRGRQVEPQEVTQSLVKQLVEDVHTHDLVVIVWTKAYAQSFWCALEMNAALLAEKPLFIITADNYPLCRELCDIVGTDRRAQVDITPAYRTSEAVSLIENLTSKRQAVQEQSEVRRKMERLVSEFEAEYRDTPLLSDQECIRYAHLVWKLRRSDDQGNLHNGIKYFSDRAAFDQGFRSYLEYAATGMVEAKMESRYYLYLLEKILDVEFLPPVLPEKIRELYEHRIAEVFRPPQQEKVENLINEMVAECLFTKEFVEYFGYFLRTVRQNHGRLVADNYWDLCTSRISEAV
jgi:hypothetical protein